MESNFESSSSHSLATRALERIFRDLMARTEQSIQLAFTMNPGYTFSVACLKLYTYINDISPDQARLGHPYLLF